METFFYIGVLKRPFSQKNAKYDGKIIFFHFFVNGCVLTIGVA
jgi:hypothetical protein